MSELTFFFILHSLLNNKSKSKSKKTLFKFNRPDYDDLCFHATSAF